MHRLLITRARGPVVSPVYRGLAAGLALAGLLLGSPAAAQTAGGERNELVVFAGVSLADQTTQDALGIRRLAGLPPDGLLPVLRVSATFGGSAEFGVRYRRGLTDRVSFEGDFSVAPNHDLQRRVSYGCPENALCIAIVVPDFLDSRQYVAYHYGAGASIDLWQGPATVSAVAGLGGVTWSGDALSHSQLAVRAGGALRSAIDRLMLHVEVVDVIVADHFITGRAAHDVHVRVGVGVKW